MQKSKMLPRGCCPCTQPGGGTESNPVQIIQVCFICQHRNPIQNAFKLLKGTISVTHWIIFFDAKRCQWTSFPASCMQKLTCTLQSIFCTRFIIADKYAHLAHVSRVIHLFSKRACSPARFMETIRHGK